jgi:hypothetical protein
MSTRLSWSATTLIAIAWIATAGCQMMPYPIRGPQPPAPVPESADVPTRVARLSYLEGSVSFRASGTQDWAPALLNRPLTDGDQLWTEPAARAELDLGSVALRLDARASLNFLDLDDHTAQIKMTQGVIGVRLRRLAAGDTFEIDTPSAAFTLLRPGDYRVEAQADVSLISVRAGEAHVASTPQTFTVYASQQARIQGTEAATYQIVPAPALDAFDEFCQARDRCQEQAQTARYVSPDVIGANDLDEFGFWQEYADWGPVWIPRHVPAGWAPYRFGRWVWMEPWGWTWVDDAPWGFAPFHYGRWVFVDRGWGWIPGPRHVTPVYAPALVVFVGGGKPGFRYFLWMGRAEVAWFPLGPGEAYIPPYKCTRGHLTDINITNTNIADPLGLPGIDMTRQRYGNQAVPGAITAVLRDTFVGGGSIGRAAAAVPPGTAAAARATGSAAPVAPIGSSVSPGLSRAVPRPPETIRNRPVLVWRVPAPAPVPMERTQALRNGQPGRPPDRSVLDELRRAQPTPRPDVRPVQPAGAKLERTPAQPVLESKEQKQRARAIAKETGRIPKGAPKPELPERRPE